MIGPFRCHHYYPFVSCVFARGISLPFCWSMLCRVVSRWTIAGVERGEEGKSTSTLPKGHEKDGRILGTAFSSYFVNAGNYAEKGTCSCVILLQKHIATCKSRLTRWKHMCLGVEESCMNLSCVYFMFVSTLSRERSTLSMRWPFRT